MKLNFSNDEFALGKFQFWLKQKNELPYTITSPLISIIS